MPALISGGAEAKIHTAFKGFTVEHTITKSKVTRLGLDH